jgi:Na+-driven multidrug efflux pump
LRGGRVRNPNARRYDREILYLALPALGALAAEPTYVLVDTAIVGHLGTPQLAVLILHLGVVGVWVALNVLMAVRLITCGARFVGRRWVVTGASTMGRA